MLVFAPLDKGLVLLARDECDDVLLLKSLKTHSLYDIVLKNQKKARRSVESALRRIEDICRWRDSEHPESTLLHRALKFGRNRKSMRKRRNGAKKD